MARQLRRGVQLLKQKPKYDWNNWTNGRVWELKKGEDFHNNPTSFRTLIYNVAVRRNMIVSTSVDGDSIYLQFATK